MNLNLTLNNKVNRGHALIYEHTIWHTMIHTIVRIIVRYISRIYPGNSTYYSTYSWTYYILVWTIKRLIIYPGKSFKGMRDKVFDAL